MLGNRYIIIKQYQINSKMIFRVKNLWPTNEKLVLTLIPKNRSVISDGRQTSNIIIFRL